MELFFTTLFLLIIGHAVADYPLQGDFLARGKNHTNPIPGVPWYQCLAAHCFIHAGAVYMVTGSVFLAACELVIHCFIDYSKCNGDIDYNVDQLFHVLTKVVLALIFVYGWMP